MNRPTKLQAAGVSAALSLLFMVVYGGSSWITAHRGEVGTWHYSWERFIPFVPIMIVPYMSIDLFFVAGPFLCSDRSELRLLAKRISFAILAAGVCFLLIPLRLAQDRPSTSGWAGAIFDFLHSFDQPSNLFPSLHIALRTILGHLYSRHTKGVVRAVSHLWFSLIGFSTLLTYQHHIVDVAGGFALAGLCFYLFPSRAGRSPVVPNYRIGAYYGIGTLFAFGVAWMAWPWSGILLWPGAALALTTAGYWGVGPSIYRKMDRRLPLVTRLLFAPVIVGQRLSLRFYRRECAAWNVITPNLWIGALLNQTEGAEARRHGVSAVLDLTAEFSETPELRSVVYRNIPVLDLTAPTLEQLNEALAFIAEHTAHGLVLIHCKIGYSRSAAVAGAYLLATGRAATVCEAIAQIRRARPTIRIRPEIHDVLERFHGSPHARPRGRKTPVAV